LKKISPKIVYAATRATPIKIEGKTQYIGAYILKISNTSRKTAEEITFQLRAGGAALRIEDVKIPPGFLYDPEVGDNCIKLSFPYLKPGDKMEIKTVAEGYYIPESLDVSARSRNNIKVEQIEYDERPSIFNNVNIPFASAGLIAAVLVWSFSRAGGGYRPFRPTPQAFTRSSILISAATNAGLPHLVELYVDAPDPTYYDEGNLAYSLASASKPEEIDRYRRMLSITLSTAPEMEPESQANLFYCLGEIDLLLSDEKSAVSDFQNAIAKSKSTVEMRIGTDPRTREFLIKKGLS
jgi:hypothetical protein